jgi:hypothetical protein
VSGWQTEINIPLSFAASASDHKRQTSGKGVRQYCVDLIGFYKKSVVAALRPYYMEVDAE